MANFRRGHVRDPSGNMHSPAFRLMTARGWGGAWTSWSSGRGDAIPITGVFQFLTFLLLTLSKGIFMSHQTSRIVGPILRFFEIGIFLKWKKMGCAPYISTNCVSISRSLWCANACNRPVKIITSTQLWLKFWTFLK